MSFVKFVAAKSILQTAMNTGFCAADIQRNSLYGRELRENSSYFT